MSRPIFEPHPALSFLSRHPTIQSLILRISFDDAELALDLSPPPKVDDLSSTAECLSRLLSSPDSMHRLRSATCYNPRTVTKISSISGITTNSQYQYNASKAASVQLTTLLAQELRRPGVSGRVNSITPGPFPSEMATFESDEHTKPTITNERSHKWPNLLELAETKVSFALDLRIECENHIIQLSQVDHAPAPPPRTERAPSSSPGWYKILFATRTRGYVELCDESQDAELELFVWSYMQYIVGGRTVIWKSLRREVYKLMNLILSAHLPSSEQPGLFNIVGTKALTAASPFAFAFITKMLIADSDPPLLSPSSSNGSSATDSTSFSHGGDPDDDANLSVLKRPLCRRKFTAISESIAQSQVSLQHIQAYRPIRFLYP
ncbi:hypothetical protein F5146DRAFT_1143120 [Armillaria mellea]|nr:hypothetical protein F5146DRAFT_1143120 [Armillaria mellea]